MTTSTQKNARRFVMFIAAFPLLCMTMFAQSTVEVSPEVNTVSPGSTVTVNINVTDVTDLHTVVVGVAFDKSILQFVGTSVGSFLKSNQSGYSVFYYEKRMPTTDPDSVRVDQAILGRAAVDGSGDVFSITFEALKEGVSPVTINKIELRNSPNYLLDATPVHGTIVVGESSNRSPLVTSIPPERAVLMQELTYQMAVSDPDGDPLTYRIVEGPSFLYMDATSGLVTATPDKLGKHVVVLRASDGKGGTATQSFTLSVFRTDHPPSIPEQVTPEDKTTLTGMIDTLRWTESLDPRTSDFITYTVRIRSSNIDTVISGLTATFFPLERELLEVSRIYSWTVAATDGIDTVLTENAFTFRTPSPTPVEPLHSAAVSWIEIEQNFPNPFSAETAIRFSLHRPDHVTVAVYNASGARVALLNDMECAEGTYVTQWNGMDGMGRRVSPGCYYCVVSTMHSRDVVKMILQH